ncbi:MAG TPA: OmpA family protein [Pedobacter sp.]
MAKMNFLKGSKWLYLSGLTLLTLGASSCFLQSKARRKHSYQEKLYKELKDSLQEAEVSILNDSIKVLFPNDLLFPTGSYEFYPQSRPLMARFAGALNKYNHTGILINGYTDNTGDEQSNLKLSEQRAKTAEANLIADNVDSTRIDIWGIGEAAPIASNATEEGRRRNRRVEFIVLYQYTSVQHAAAKK